MTSFPIEERDLTIGSTQIKCRIVGLLTPDKPVLVFLHEGLGSITQWRDFPERLSTATGFSALVYDRTGYGRSSPLAHPWPDDFLIHHAHALPKILAALGITKPILFGHSDGGTLALMVASLYPDLPLAAITEAAHVLIEPITKQGLRSLRDKAGAEPDFCARLLRHHPHADPAFIIQWVDTWLRPSLADWTMRAMLPAITCPLLALQGEQDEHGSPAQLDIIVHDVSGPATSRLIPDCGHVPHFDARDAVIHATQAFLENHAIKD